mmetsp:Transcript_61645/g.90390  ORF Transcript_61645/g.90390 Transcript_61645/m.90390 type:complete len:93 (+) Transcript_61645:1170-1448(+)
MGRHIVITHCFFIFGIIVTFTGVFLITFANTDDDSDKSYRSSERSQHGASGELVEAELEGLLGEERQQVDRGVDVTALLRGLGGPRFLSSEL